MPTLGANCKTKILYFIPVVWQLHVSSALFSESNTTPIQPSPREAALEMLEDQEAKPFVAEPPNTDLLLPEETLSALRARSAGPQEAAGIDTLHKNGLLSVEKLTVNQCVQLLRRYIIALGVMDCSIMMSLQAVKAVGVGAGPSSNAQGDEVAGVLDMADGRRVAYCVSVVDAGPKPPTKLSSKAKHEHLIWDYVATLEKEGSLG